MCHVNKNGKIVEDEDTIATRRKIRTLVPSSLAVVRIILNSKFEFFIIEGLDFGFYSTTVLPFEHVE